MTVMNFVVAKSSNSTTGGQLFACECSAATEAVRFRQQGFCDIGDTCNSSAYRSMETARKYLTGVQNWPSEFRSGTASERFGQSAVLSSEHESAYLNVEACSTIVFVLEYDSVYGVQITEIRLVVVK